MVVPGWSYSAQCLSSCFVDQRAVVFLPFTKSMKFNLSYIIYKRFRGCYKLNRREICFSFQSFVSQQVSLELEDTAYFRACSRWSNTMNWWGDLPPDQTGFHPSAWVTLCYCCTVAGSQCQRDSEKKHTRRRNWFLEVTQWLKQPLKSLKNTTDITDLTDSYS